MGSGFLSIPRCYCAIHTRCHSGFPARAPPRARIRHQQSRRRSQLASGRFCLTRARRSAVDASGITCLLGSESQIAAYADHRPVRADAAVSSAGLGIVLKRSKRRQVCGSHGRHSGGRISGDYGCADRRQRELGDRERGLPITLGSVASRGSFGRLRRAWRADAGDRQALSAGHLATVSSASDAQATLPEPGEGARRGGR